MFRLTRTYSVASFLGIVLVTIALGIFYKTIAVRSLIEHETLSNVSLAQSISNNLWPVYADFVSRAAAIPAPELGRQPEIARRGAAGYSTQNAPSPTCSATPRPNTPIRK